LYACDAKWWDEYRPVFAGERWTVDVAGARLHGLNWIEGVNDPGLCTRLERIHTGGNSGYQAIGLARNWGACRIVLLGFDMQATGSKAHWHADHPERIGNVGPYAQWRERFAKLAADLVDDGVEVLNATAKTALECFERRDLLAALNDPSPAPQHMPLLVKGMNGLGDDIYQRAAVRELTSRRKVYLETSWPELYADLPVIPVRPETKLRTQTKNLRGTKAAWGAPPVGTQRLALTYAGKEGTMLQALLGSAGVDAGSVTFDLPRFVKPKKKPYIVVRPVTVRKEWPALSRSPLPEYIARAAARLRHDFRVISVADVADGQEWALEPLPEADETYHHGELSVSELLGLVAGSAGGIGGVGWLVPASMALKVPMLLIFGGCLFHNGPGRIFDSRIDSSLIHQVMPDRPCYCGSKDHACNKTISRIDEHIERWALGLTAKRRTAVAA
jgi:hypothetical protein